MGTWLKSARQSRWVGGYIWSRWVGGRLCVNIHTCIVFEVEKVIYFWGDVPLWWVAGLFCVCIRVCTVCVCVCVCDENGGLSCVCICVCTVCVGVMKRVLWGGYGQ